MARGKVSALCFGTSAGYPGNPAVGLHVVNLVKESAITVRYELLTVHLGSLMRLCKKAGAEGCLGRTQ